MGEGGREHCSHPNYSPQAQVLGERPQAAHLTWDLRRPEALPFSRAEVQALPPSWAAPVPSLPRQLWDVPEELRLCPGACDLFPAAALEWEGPGCPQLPLLGTLSFSL